MQPTPEFLLHGALVPRLIPQNPDADLTPEQLGDNVAGFSRSAEIHSACADLEQKMHEADGDAAAVAAVVAAAEERSKTGDIAASHSLGRWQLEGVPQVPKDEFKALERLDRAAMAGFAPAQTLIGYYYRVTAKQPRKALPFLFAAAEQGDARAQVLMSDSLEKGIDGALQPDALEALRYLRRATDGRSVQKFYRGLAAAILADKYAEGRGVGRDIQEAIRWNRKALEFGYTGNRVDLIQQLKTTDAAANAQEIDTLLAAASEDGDPRAKAVVSDDRWNSELAVWKHGPYSVDFWTRRFIYTGSDTHSSTSIRSTPGTQHVGPSVYSVTDSWRVLQFKDPDGHEIKITPSDGGRTMVINPGQEVMVLYAGPTQDDGNAKGFPYRLYKVGQSDVGDAQSLDTLTKQLGLKNPSNFWFVLVAIGLGMFAIGGMASLVGILLAAGSAFAWYKARTRVSDTRRALEEHMDRIGAWVAALA